LWLILYCGECHPCMEFGIWNFIILLVSFDVHISWNLSFITITPKHIVFSMLFNSIKHFSISYIIQFNNNLEEYVTCYKVHYFYNKSCSFFLLKLDCESSSLVLLQDDHVDLILFLVGKTLVAPNSSFSTKYYHTPLLQIGPAHKPSFRKFKLYYCISPYQHLNPITTYQQINK
jgi:hypothetical protein